MRGTRRTMTEEEPIRVSNGEPPPKATCVLMEMMKTMRRQNEERAEEFRRGQEETSTSSKRLKEYSLLSAGLRLNAFVKNAVAFLKLI